MFGEGAISALLAPFDDDVPAAARESSGRCCPRRLSAGSPEPVGLVGRRPTHPLGLLGVAAIASGGPLVVIFNYALIFPTAVPAVSLTGLAGFPSAVFGAAQGYALQVYAPPGLRGRCSPRRRRARLAQSPASR